MTDQRPGQSIEQTQRKVAPQSLRVDEVGERGLGAVLGPPAELVDHARAAGLRAEVDVQVNGASVPSAIGGAAFRIVQEALTNVRRHAPGAAVDVELHYGDDALRLRIRDNGPGAGAGRDTPPGGHGLLGMRERAAAVGGELATGEAPGGGFLVEATLPAKAEGA